MNSHFVLPEGGWAYGSFREVVIPLYQQMLLIFQKTGFLYAVQPKILPPSARGAIRRLLIPKDRIDFLMSLIYSCLLIKNQELLFIKKTRRISRPYYCIGGGEMHGELKLALRQSEPVLRFRTFDWVLIRENFQIFIYTERISKIGFEPRKSAGVGRFLKHVRYKF